MIRVLIADDHPLMRQGLTDLLRTTADISVVAVAEDGDVAVDVALRVRPDVVLMDLVMPRLDGAAATRAILAVEPDIRIVVLTSLAQPERITDAIDAGAVGYLLKDSEPDEIVRAVTAAAAGHAPLDPRVATALLPRQRHASRADALSPRERDVLALVGAGLPNKTIAVRLGISEKTVKAHLGRIFARIGVSDRTAAALWAQRHDLIV
ncbi:MAG TPA: response regulator transcription factor [Mycobacteriales bacterium]|nr:response regulator transcription factor [Mycobacteriales bacterium]